MMEKMFSKKNLREKNKTFRNLNLAAAVSLGILSSGGVVAQSTETNNLDNDTIEVNNEQNKQIIKGLEVLINSAYVGDKISAYEEDINKIIEQNLKFSSEEASYLIDNIMNKFMGSSESNEKNRISEINKKLLSFLYKEKSPFCLELSSEKVIPIKSNLDIYIPDTKGRILFNHILSKDFTEFYTQIDKLISRKDQEGNTIGGIYTLYSNDKMVKVSIGIGNAISSTENDFPSLDRFSVSINDDGSDYNYSFFLEHNLLKDNDDAELIQKIFDKLVLEK